MIKLFSPRAGADKYFVLEDYLFGPSDIQGKTYRELTRFDSKLSTFKQLPGRHGENGVRHEKIEGNFLYNPMLECTRPAPTEHYPYGIEFPSRDYRNVFGWRPARHGVAVDGDHATVHWYLSARIGRFTRAVKEDPDNPGLWTILEVEDHPVAEPGTVMSTKATKILAVHPPDQYGRFRVDIARHTWNVGIVRRPSGYAGGPSHTFESLSQRFSDEVLNMTTRTHTVLCTMYTSECDAIYNPRTSQGILDGIVKSIFPKDFPLEDVHYGNLAYSAAKKMNVNNVNMLEFLYELKTPLSFLVKLANLKKLPRNLTKIRRRARDLKTAGGASDAYLSMKYGVLPTISELSEIMEAMKGLKPYFDKNGFKTYSAGYQNSLIKDNLKYELYQHVKLAVEDEDAQLKRLVNQIESFGFLPNLENIWDLVSYSFVIDWFIDVGGLLARADSINRVSRLDMKYVTQSRKTVVSGNISHRTSDHPFTGSVKWVHYHRWVSDQCPVPPLSLNTTFQDFNHWLESSALIIQRTKRR